MWREKDIIFFSSPLLLHSPTRFLAARGDFSGVEGGPPFPLPLALFGVEKSVSGCHFGGTILLGRSGRHRCEDKTVGCCGFGEAKAMQVVCLGGMAKGEGGA